MIHENKTQRLALTALMAALIIISIMFLRIPVPVTGGIIHPGDTFIFLAVMMLGIKNAAIAGSVGASLANILSGLSHWAPWTFVIKGVMAIIMGMVFNAMGGKKPETSQSKKFGLYTVGMIIGGIWQIAGYAVAYRAVIGSWGVALWGVIGDVIQTSVAIVLVLILANVLRKTPMKKHFI